MECLGNVFTPKCTIIGFRKFNWRRIGSFNKILIQNMRQSWRIIGSFQVTKSAYRLKPQSLHLIGNEYEALVEKASIS